MSHVPHAGQQPLHPLTLHLVFRPTFSVLEINHSDTPWGAESLVMEGGALSTHLEIGSMAPRGHSVS